ncbi:MAG: hypothetical protein KJO62_09670 [Gammaproteobacteria bacterium]|nr:hypothetical protein [Gammaproteobacteria bacterium]NND40294.1 hypothetical protein [Pseudomonadales bacterium]RZV51831.1 MAG: hypothetical protein EX270_10025 [Pseudomonadales bacterium]
MQKVSVVFAVALMSLLLALSVVPSAYAQEGDKKLSKEEKEKQLKFKDGITRKRKAVGPTCAKRLERVQEYVAEEQWSEAEKQLKGALVRACSEGFEHSEVNRFLGYVYYSQEKYDLAISTYLKFVNEPEADLDKKTDTRYTVAQLMFMTENYKGAANQLEKWMQEATVVARDGKILLGRCYYNLGRKNEALKLVEDVMKESRTAKQTPKESWLNFQWVLYYEKEQYKKAVGVNRILLTEYPKIKYWKQISAMFGALEDSEKEMLALDLTYRQGGLDKEKQFIALAYQYMAFDVPMRAARMLEEAMEDGFVEKNQKNLEVLGAAYQRSQEFRLASPVLEQAAKMADDGNAWSRLAGVYLNLNENEKALVASINALSKGGLKRPDLAWMNRGTAEAALHCYDLAADSFGRAERFDRAKKGAANWKRYVQMEGERRAKLIANGAKLATCKKV